jgi:ribosomal protein L14E/L6E/L27E
MGQVGPGIHFNNDYELKAFVEHYTGKKVVLDEQANNWVTNDIQYEAKPKDTLDLQEAGELPVKQEIKVGSKVKVTGGEFSGQTVRIIDVIEDVDGSLLYYFEKGNEEHVLFENHVELADAGAVDSSLDKAKNSRKGGKPLNEIKMTYKDADGNSVTKTAKWWLDDVDKRISEIDLLRDCI